MYKVIDLQFIPAACEASMNMSKAPKFVPVYVLVSVYMRGPIASLITSYCIPETRSCAGISSLREETNGVKRVHLMHRLHSDCAHRTSI